MSNDQITTNASVTHIEHIQAMFLDMVPRIELHGNIYFRYVRCQSTKEDAIAEMIGLSWKWFLRLVQRGKDPANFVSTIATYAAKAVRSGRRVTGQEKAKDVMSPRAQQIHAFAVGKLPELSTLSSNPLTDALVDNTQTPPDEQAAFRLDFAVWLAELGAHRRQVAEELMMGERTRDVAAKRGVSPSRISQLRREFEDHWEQFTRG
jgi:hypothetical protein